MHLDLQLEALDVLETPDMTTGQVVGLALIGLGTGILVGMGIAALIT